jgi:hypothetical protein
MNKDFQKFVVLVANTIKERTSQPGAVSVPDLLKEKVAGGSSTLQDALGDIISSIRLG